jgi:hypothetical protein
MSDTSYFFDSRLAKTDPINYIVDKEVACRANLKYMNMKLQKMFRYEGLPETIPSEMLEYYIINNGTCFIAKVNDELYALMGSFGGEPDAYYRPTRYVVANPGLRFSKDCDIVNDGVLMRNDPLWMGLYPLMSKYAALITENMLTLRTADVMLRVMAMLSAPDDKTKIAAEQYLKDLENGKLGVIGENRFFDDGVKMQSPPSNNGSYLTQFIELHQYLTASFYNEIGLNANFNMKREAIGDGESSLNEDSLLPLCEIMLRCRKEDVEKVNSKFGTNITVDFDSAWLNNQKEIALELKKLENEASQLAESDENSVEGGECEPTGDQEDADIIDSDDVPDGSSGESDGTTSDEHLEDEEGTAAGSELNESEERDTEDNREHGQDDNEPADDDDVTEDEEGDDDGRDKKD